MWCSLSVVLCSIQVGFGPNEQQCNNIRIHTSQYIVRVVVVVVVSYKSSFMALPKYIWTKLNKKRDDYNQESCKFDYEVDESGEQCTLHLTCSKLINNQLLDLKQVGSEDALILELDEFIQYSLEANRLIERQQGGDVTPTEEIREFSQLPLQEGDSEILPWTEKKPVSMIKRSSWFKQLVGKLVRHEVLNVSMTLYPYVRAYTKNKDEKYVQLAGKIHGSWRNNNKNKNISCFGVKCSSLDSEVDIISQSFPLNRTFDELEQLSSYSEHIHGE